MAHVQYGTIVTNLKGKVGGNVFQGGKSGNIAKIKAATTHESKLTKADAGRIINTPQVTAEIAGLWRLLTDAERASWDTNAVNFPAYNRFGEAYTPSGYQVFVTLNFQIKRLAGSLAYTCPMPVTINPMPVFSIAQPDLTSLDVTWAGGIQTDCNIRVEATQPMGAGRKPKNSFFKVIAQWDDATSSPEDLFPSYAAVFGSFPVGAKIYFRFTSYSIISGQRGVPVIVELLTT